MTNVPRRLPPTQGQRIRNVTITHASLSGQGRTAAARPVSQSRPTPQIYRPSSVQNVVTGTGDTSATSITSTPVGGSGSSAAAGPLAVAIGDRSFADGPASVAIGASAFTEFTGNVAVGQYSQANAGRAVALGSYAEASGGSAVAVGYRVRATADGAVAIGVDSSGIPAAATVQDAFALGTNQHHVIIAGSLILADSSNGLHRLVVSTSGVLSTVAYP